MVSTVPNIWIKIPMEQQLSFKAAGKTPKAKEGSWQPF